MVNYLKLGYSSELGYETAFDETLLETNRTHNFYVDWGKYLVIWMFIKMKLIF